MCTRNNYHWKLEYVYVCAEERLTVSSTSLRKWLSGVTSTSTTFNERSLQWGAVLRHNGEWYGAQYQSAVWYMGCYGYTLLDRDCFKEHVNALQFVEYLITIYNC